MGAHGRTMGRNRQSHETDVWAGSHEGPDVRQPVVFVMKIYIAPRWLTLAPFLLSEPFRRFVRIPRGARSHRNGLARWRQTVEDALRKVDDGRGDFATTRLWPDTAECPWDSAMSGHSPGGERPRPNPSRFFCLEPVDRAETGVRTSHILLLHFLPESFVWATCCTRRRTGGRAWRTGDTKATFPQQRTRQLPRSSVTCGARGLRRHRILPETTHFAI